jgi:hypothetical protein
LADCVVHPYAVADDAGTVPSLAEHQDEIKEAYGLKEFTGAEATVEAWVDARAWTTGDGPRTIFYDAVPWLRRGRAAASGCGTLWPAARPGAAASG